MTKNGNIILNLIEEVTCHPTAEDVYQLLHDRQQSMSMATVYNNLNNLSMEGRIRKISIPGHPEHYDKLKPHDHLICSKCGKIEDLFLKNRKRELEKEAGTDIASYDLQLFHLCKLCK